jgi:DNA-binding transcriptional LysR family regulator
MDFLQLEYFLEVARRGNMSAVAAKYHVAQSSVSRSIGRLEEELGVPLFERQGRGIFLNDYGTAFYDRVERVFREMNDGQQELKQMRDAYAGRVSISTSSARQINRLMVQFLEENPDVLFRQRRITDMHDIKEKLDKGVLDYALTYGALPEMEYQWEPLIQEEYYIMVARDHALGKKESVSAEDLTGLHLLMNDVDDPDFVEQQCIAHGVNPQFTFIGNEYDVIGPMVERGMGVGLVTTMSLFDLKKNLPSRRLSEIRIIKIDDEGFQRTLGILSRKHHYLSPAAKLFYRRLLDYFKVIRLEMN